MSNDERQNQVDLIFLAALDVPLDERKAFLKQRFDHVDQEILSEVEELLSMDEGATEAYLTANPHLKLGHVGKSTTAPSSEGVGSTIGKYHLLQKLGEGGMGVVYMAEQREPVKLRVALKVIKPGMDSKSVVARFEAERQALALMEHPNIAKVLDAGMTESERPYFVMELLKGVPITTYCDESKLTIKERLALFESVCQAVHHAHQKGIIHRDLKPSNILVVDYDDIPATKVIDFGLAKALQQTLTEKTLFTQFGQIVGTYEYMSPEQAKLNQLDIDTRTDIYSLGVLLYELLSGQTPFDSQTLRGKAFDEMLRIIREDDPPKPSLKLTIGPKSVVVSASRKTDPQKLQSTISGDLDAIVMKSLSKERSRRYESSSDFAKDIRRYLDGSPVMAQPPSAFYVGKKLFRRHRIIVTAAALVFVSILIGLVATSVLYQAEQRTRQGAERGEYVSNMHAVGELLASGSSNGVREILDRAPEELRSWEWDYLDGVFPKMPTKAVQAGHQKFIQSLISSPDGSWFASIDLSGTLLVWDGVSRKRKRKIKLPPTRPEAAFLWASPDNEHLMLSADGYYLINALSGKYKEFEIPMELLGYGAGRSRTRFSFSQPDGRQMMVSRGNQNSFLVFDLFKDDVVLENSPNGLLGSRFTPWPGVVASTGPHPDGSLQGQAGYFLLWNLADESHHDEIRVTPPEDKQSLELEFSPSGEKFITYDPQNFGDVVVRDYATRRELCQFDTSSNGFNMYSPIRLAFSPDDSQFAMPLPSGGVMIFDIPSQETTILRGHENSSRGVAFRSTSEVITSGLDRQIHFWDSATPPAHYDFPAHTASAWCCFSPQGDLLATVVPRGRIRNGARTIKLWAFPSLQLERTFRWHQIDGNQPSILFSPDGQLLVGKSYSCFRLWDTKTGKVLGTKYLAKGALQSLKFSAGGKELIALLSNGECRKINVDTLEDRLIAKYDQDSYVMNVSHDGNWMAGGGLSGRFQLTDVVTSDTRTLGNHDTSINSICFDAAARQVACSGHDRMVTFYGLPYGRHSFELRDQSRIRQCGFFPGDENRFISATDRHLRIWDLAKRKPVLTMTMEDGFTNFAVHPTGDLLCVGRHDGNIRFWERKRPTPDKVRERRLQKHAMHLVEKEFRSQLWAADVRAKLQAAEMAPHVKSMALSYLQVRGDQFDVIVNQIRQAVSDPNKDAASYSDALTKLQSILKQVEDAPQFENLLGVAQLRAGNAVDAIETLYRAKAKFEQIPLMPDESYASKHRGLLLGHRANNLAFLAMALEKADRTNEAVDALSEMKAITELSPQIASELPDEVNHLESLLHDEI